MQGRLGHPPTVVNTGSMSTEIVGEEIEVYVQDGQLRTEHRFYLSRLNFLTLHYTMERVAQHGLRRAAEMDEVCDTLADLGLTYDTWHYHHQNQDFFDLAQAVPEVPCEILLCHKGRMGHREK